HTWPEHGYAAVDVFTCGQHTDPNKAIPVLRHYFKPQRVQVMEMNRGIVTEEECADEEQTEAEYAAVC
ncbi:MAG TPA: S-adenosylmethionine decarboxylase, partial [Armatimonadota bacterium]